MLKSCKHVVNNSLKDMLKFLIASTIVFVYACTRVQLSYSNNDLKKAHTWQLIDIRIHILHGYNCAIHRSKTFCPFILFNIL